MALGSLKYPTVIFLNPWHPSQSLPFQHPIICSCAPRPYGNPRDGYRKWLSFSIQQMIIECVLLHRRQKCAKNQDLETGKWKESYHTKKEAQTRENAQAHVIAQREARARPPGGGNPARSAVCWRWLTTVYISSQLPCSDFVGSLKWALLGEFTPQKSANVPDQGFFWLGDVVVKHSSAHHWSGGTSVCQMRGSGESFQPESAA